jgi:hypothetical protein
MWRASSAARARNVGCALPVAVSDALTIQPNGSMPARRECRELGARAGGFAQRAGLGAGDQYERRQRCVGQGADGGGVLLASGEATVGGYFIDESRWNRL